MRLAPASLRGRLVLAFAVFGLATWLAVGVALFVALRGLHAQATTARLADVAVPLVARARADLGSGMTIPAILADLRDQVGGTDVGVYMQLADGRVVAVGGEVVALDGLTVDPALPQGAIDHGSYRAPDGTTYAWVASILRGGVRGSRALIAAAPDPSGAAALRDLLGTLPAVGLVTLVVGVLVASWLARSISGPLRRLADATGRVPDGLDAPALPLEGPTEVRDLTLRFDAMRADLATARVRETALLADLRHDLRTPLTVIAGFAEALRDGTARDGDAERAADAIAAEAARIADLVADLGATEGLGAGRPLRLERVDLGEAAADAANRFAGVAADAGVELVVLPPAGRTVVTADRRAVDRIVSNLVSNALAAVGSPTRSREGGRGHVWLEARAATAAPDGSGAGQGVEAVVLAVTDDGPGFPPGGAARAFERFVRGDPARSGPGSGLGLAIVRELAHAHGGAAHAENVAPHGARVSVTLPRAPLVGVAERGPTGPSDEADPADETDLAPQVGPDDESGRGVPRGPVPPGGLEG